MSLPPFPGPWHQGGTLTSLTCSASTLLLWTSYRLQLSHLKIPSCHHTLPLPSFISSWESRTHDLCFSSPHFRLTAILGFLPQRSCWGLRQHPVAKSSGLIPIFLLFDLLADFDKGDCLLLEMLLSLAFQSSVLSLCIPAFLIIPSWFLFPIPSMTCVLQASFLVSFSRCILLGDLTDPVAMLKTPKALSPACSLPQTSWFLHPPARGPLAWLTGREIQHCHPGLASDSGPSSSVFPVMFPQGRCGVCEFLPQRPVSLLYPFSSSFPRTLKPTESLSHVSFVS